MTSTWLNQSTEKWLDDYSHLTPLSFLLGFWITRYCTYKVDQPISEPFYTFPIDQKLIGIDWITCTLIIWSSVNGWILKFQQPWRMQPSVTAVLVVSSLAGRQISCSRGGDHFASHGGLSIWARPCGVLFFLLQWSRALWEGTPSFSESLTEHQNEQQPLVVCRFSICCDYDMTRHWNRYSADLIFSKR